MSAGETSRARGTRGRTRRQRSRRYGATVALGPLTLQRVAVRGSGWQATKLLSLFVAGMLAGFLTVFMTFDNFYVSGAQVTGTHLLTPAQVYGAAGVEGYNIFWLNDAQIEARLRQALPYVQSVRVRAALSGQVHIDVQERVPRLEWRTGQGAAWVDEQGVALPPLEGEPGEALSQLVDAQGDAAVPQAPGIPAPGPGGFPVVHMQPSVLAVLNELAGLLPGRQTYAYDAVNGLHFQSAEGTNVVFGLQGDLVHKVALLRAIQDEWQSLGRTPSLIDLRIEDRPFVR